MNDLFGDLRLSDAVTFLAVRRTGTMAMAARELGVTPSQVTKAIARLEKQMGAALLVRTERGVSITDAGHLWAAEFAHWVSRSRTLQQQRQEHVERLTMVAPPLLHELFVPVLAGRFDKLMLRGVQLPSRYIRSPISEHVFELALVQDDIGWLPGGWEARFVGEVRSGLFASPETARSLGPAPISVEQATALRFVTPVFISERGELFAGEDRCPIPLTRRRTGHETQTVSTALEISARTDQVVFGPRMAAHTLADAGRLVEIPVEGWNVSFPLYLACAVDQVKASVFEQLHSLLKSCLIDFDRLSPATTPANDDLAA